MNKRQRRDVWFFVIFFGLVLLGIFQPHFAGILIVAACVIWVQFS